MAVAAGLTVGLLFLLGLVLLRKGIRKPHWVLAILLLLSAAYFYGEEQLQRDTEGLLISPLGTSACPANHLQVALTNDGPRDVLGFSFELRGFQRDHSNSVAQQVHRTDRIVRSGQSWTNCWPVDDLEDVSDVSAYRTDFGV